MTTGCTYRAHLGAPQTFSFRICHLSIIALLFLSPGIVGAPLLLQHCFCTHISWQQCTWRRWTWPREWASSVPVLWAGGVEWQGQVCPAKHSAATIAMLLLFLCLMSYQQQQQQQWYCVFKGSLPCLDELRTEMQGGDHCHLWLWIGCCCDATS